ncbi:hypothetical protein PCC7418_0179 [Halothece sp. PCC 7418]|nr:hypothetical protein PCC7418_0179 [Halothece sp. PCC 7418]
MGVSLGTVASVFSAHTAYAQAISITDVEINSTAEGINLVLETNNETTPETFETRYGKTIALDLINTQLNLPQGESFQQDNPAPGIASIAVSQRYANNVRVTITGETDVPDIAITTEDNQLVVGLNQSTPTASNPSQPSTPTSPVGGETEGEVIELVVLRWSRRMRETFAQLSLV